MLRSALTALAILAATATASRAFDIEAMTGTEREAFRAEIRAYLLENPEVLMEAIQVLEDRRAQTARTQDRQLLDRHRAAIFEDGDSWVGGNPDGDVTIVEFLDYRCGYCKRAHPAVQELLSSDGDIRYIVKEFPILGEESVAASRYAISVLHVEGDDAYRRVNDALMTWNGAITDGALARISREAGVDHAAVMAHRDSDEVSAMIARNRALAEKLQIRGTPSFVMGDALVRGYVELEQMRAIVEDLREGRG